MNSKTAWMVLFAGTFYFLVLPSADAEAPFKISEVVSVEDLAAEAQAKLALLEKHLADNESYLAAKKKKIPQAAGTLACLAQALVEHSDGETSNIAAADLRDAALQVIGSKSYEDAAVALSSVKQAVAGNSSGSASNEHAWNKLINLHRLMEEVRARNSKLRRVTRKSRDPNKDSLHASTLAVLAIAMHADTHEVKSAEDVAKWQEYSVELQQAMTKVSAALKAGDTKTANSLWRAGQKSCSACHKAYRDE